MTNGATNQISTAAIDQVLSAPHWSLRFPPALEARFERDTGAARSRYLATSGAIALSMNVLFLVADYFVLPDVFKLAILVRLGIVDLLGFTACAVVWRNPRPWLREALDAGTIVLAAAGFLGLYLASHSPLVVHAHYAVVLVLIFPNIIQRLRFPYAVACSAAVIVLCAAAVPRIHGMPAAAAFFAILTLATAAILSLHANWRFEQDERRRYLEHLREILIGEQLAGINRELSAASVLDPLTGLGNRRRLDQFVDALWLAGRGRHGPVGFLMIDIDFFKSFNDEFGHQAGDECLKAVAALIQQQLRPGRDLGVRYGGEEFLVVLPDTDLTEAIGIAEGIRASIESRAIARPLAATGDVVTVSIGAAVVRPDDTETSAPGIAAADAAMYAAKQHQRNCVWPPLTKPA
ncbi:MAG: diguanylate cyclase [Pseudolabrys sp.]|nr:diguanylate cyclase [Pseudolabrys sp.]